MEIIFSILLTAWGLSILGIIVIEQVKFQHIFLNHDLQDFAKK